VIAIILFFVLILVSRLFRKPIKRLQTKVREEAIKRGIKVEDVERNLPVFSDSNRIRKYGNFRCVKYSMARHYGAQPKNWSFLQRTKKEGAQYDNGWLYQSEYEPTPNLQQALKKIASEWDQDLLELESNESEISAYCDELSGMKEFLRVYSYLSELSAI
jgi:hypothetical protein